MRSLRGRESERGKEGGVGRSGGRGGEERMRREEGEGGRGQAENSVAHSVMQRQKQAKA
jgi:hypothetical protein